MADENKTLETGLEEVKNETAHDEMEAAVENAFFGTYAHSLDGKGRIIIPVGYRKALGEKFTIGPTRDFQGIALYPRKVWLKMLMDMQKLNQRKPVVQQYMNQFNKLSFPDAEADGQGRLLLPAKIRQRMLGDERDVEIAGAFDHLRIVSSAKAEAEDEAFQENLTDILSVWGDME